MKRKNQPPENERVSINNELSNKIFGILESANHGFYPASASINAFGVIMVSYEKRTDHYSFEKENFFDLNPTNKILNVYASPKSSLTERVCAEFLSDLKKQGYKINGEAFFSPRFRHPNEISLY
jgi:hypothetical protein